MAILAPGVCFDRICAPLRTQNPESAEKFALLADLGIIETPENYVHATQLETFKRIYGEKFYKHYYHEAITDQNFGKVTTKLIPGQKLHVRAWKQVVPGDTTSFARMEFLEEQNSIYTGAQGLSLVFEQKRDDLVKGYRYVSFDKNYSLWRDAVRLHRVPLILVRKHRFGFALGYFDAVWQENDAFLSFEPLTVI